MLLRRHNLNLIPILRELLRTRSVSQTADLVGLSQSAVSTALARLREIFDDELLVMVGRKMVLTEKGAQLIPQTEKTFLEMETLLRPSNFDPLEETRRFVIATADYVPMLLAPHLARLLAERAPHASVHFVDVPDNVESALVRGVVDTIIVPGDTMGELNESLNSAPLWYDEMVVIATKATGRLKTPLTRESYETSRHAMFQMSARNENSHSILGIRSADIVQRNVVIVQQFAALPGIVENSDCLALIQKRIADRFQQIHEIEVTAPPFEIAPIEIRAFWGKALERDPAHAWFRSLLKSASASLSEPVRSDAA